MLLIDDLQWCDGETLAWLHYFLRQDVRAPILIVGTTRMDEIGEVNHRVRTLITALQATDQVSELELFPLDEEATTQLVTALIGWLPDPTWAARLYRFTQGNPLFIVEMVTASVEEIEEAGWGKNDLTLSTTPLKVQAVIQARLQHLSSGARELAALASAVGHSFTLLLLVAASRSGEEATIAALDELWQRRFVREQEAGVYVFSHERLSETIYREISPIRRQTFHHRIAEALEGLHQEGPETVAAQLAFQYEQAMQAQHAASWYRRAAAEQRNIYASPNAAAYLRRGLMQLERMPETGVRMKLELEMLLDLGHDLRLITTQSDPQLGPVLNRAYILAQQVGDSHRLFVATVRYGSYLRASGDKRQARHLMEQLLEIGQRTKDPMHLAEAYFQNARIHTHMGNFVLTRDWLHQAIELYTPTVAQAWHTQWPDKTQTGPPRALYVANLGLVLWVLGYAEQAISQLGDAIAKVEEMQQPMYAAVTLSFSLHVYRALRDVLSVQILAERMAALGARFDVAIATYIAMPFLGWIKGEQGYPIEGIELARQGIHFLRRLGMTLFYTCHLAILTELYLQVGDLAAAKAMLDEALAVSEASDERLWDAELFRLQGNLLQAQGAPASVVERSYQQALAIAREQQARSLELPRP